MAGKGRRRAEDPGTPSGISVPASPTPAITQVSAKRKAHRKHEHQSLVEGPSDLQLGQHLHSGPDVSHDLERPRWLGAGWAAKASGCSCVLRTSLVQGPRPGALGSHCAHEPSGPALLAQREWGQSGPSEARFQASWEHWHRARCPLIGSLGEGPSRREVGKLKCRRTRRPTPGPWAPEGGRTPQLPALVTHTLCLRGQRERGLEEGRSSPGDTAEAGGRLCQPIIRLCTQAHADSKEGVYPGCLP